MASQRLFAIVFCSALADFAALTYPLDNVSSLKNASNSLSDWYRPTYNHSSSPKPWHYNVGNLFPKLPNKSVGVRGNATVTNEFIDSVTWNSFQTRLITTSLPIVFVLGILVACAVMTLLYTFYCLCMSRRHSNDPSETVPMYRHCIGMCQPHLQYSMHAGYNQGSPFNDPPPGPPPRYSTFDPITTGSTSSIMSATSSSNARGGGSSTAATAPPIRHLTRND